MKNTAKSSPITEDKLFYLAIEKAKDAIKSSRRNFSGADYSRIKIQSKSPVKNDIDIMAHNISEQIDGLMSSIILYERLVTDIVINPEAGGSLGYD